jgi:hypothetical protein
MYFLQKKRVLVPEVAKTANQGLLNPIAIPVFAIYSVC